MLYAGGAAITAWWLRLIVIEKLARFHRCREELRPRWDRRSDRSLG
jgi:hypothetical protein